MTVNGDFLSTSKFIDQLNQCIQSVFEGDLAEIPNDGVMQENVRPSVPQFELRSRFSDGTTRLLDDSERAYADYKFKLAQAAQRIAHLRQEERLEWAESHRNFGNQLFSQGKYCEAMEVYMTCLVALDQGTQNRSLNKQHESVSSTSNPSAAEDTDCDSSILDEQIKLPILLNLSACMLKLGMYQKTEKICNLCLETVPSSSKNPKIFFRRGRARTFMGSYHGAREDYNQALNLLSSSKDLTDVPKIHHELRKLDHIIRQARKNRVKQKKAMQILLGGDPETDIKAIVVRDPNDPHKLLAHEQAPLYVEESKTREYSKLKAKGPSSPKHQSVRASDSGKKYGCMGVYERISLWKQYFFLLLASFIKALLSWLGDESTEQKTLLN